MKTELKDKECETDTLYKKVGQLTTQVDWLKKNLKNCLDLIVRVNILRAQKSSKELPLSTAASLLDVNQTSAYYTPADSSEQELAAFSIHLDAQLAKLESIGEFYFYTTFGLRTAA